MNDVKTVRLFTGTFIDAEIFRTSYAGIQDYFGEFLSGKWVEYENLHFTYQFIGDFPLSDVPALKKELGPYLAVQKSELQIRGITAFPDIHRPRVLISPVFSPGNKLSEIYSETNKILSSFGYKPEQRKFKPHVTLLRIKEFRKDGIAEKFGRYKSFEAGTMSSFSYNLISSELTRSGPVYKIL